MLPSILGHLPSAQITAILRAFPLQRPMGLEAPGDGGAGLMGSVVVLLICSWRRGGCVSSPCALICAVETRAGPSRCPVSWGQLRRREPICHVPVGAGGASPPGKAYAPARRLSEAGKQALPVCACGDCVCSVHEGFARDSCGGEQEPARALSSSPLGL